MWIPFTSGVVSGWGGSFTDLFSSPNSSFDVSPTGKDDGIGVENLRGSGMIAGETSLAYNEIVTINLVSTFNGKFSLSRSYSYLHDYGED
jgi:hypothetical protein